MGNFFCCEIICCNSEKDKDLDSMKNNVYNIKEDINITYDDIEKIKDNIEI